MPTITLYGGAGTIGGNKILLEDGDSRLFFDFGTTFATRDLYFEEYLKPRPGVGLLDLLEMDLLPPLEGLYRPDLVPSGDVWARCRERPGYRETPSVDAVLVSHAHVDHTGYISFLREDVPVYASATTAFIAKAMQDSSMADFEKEVCYLSPREEHEGYLRVARESYRQRPFCFADQQMLGLEAQEFWSRSPKHIVGDTNLRRKRLKPAPTMPPFGLAGKLPARFFPVDHSVYGAGAWAVETSTGWVVYSGDIRSHGSGSKDTERFIHAVASLRPRLLLCEGTRIPKGDEAAYLLEAMRLVSPSVPGLSNSEHMLVYEDLRYKIEPWEQNLRNQFGSRLVDARQVHGSPGDYILCFSFWDAKNLIDIDIRGGAYVYSSSEAYSEEQELDFRRLREWLKHFEMRSAGLPHERGQAISDLPEEEQGLHASGHASADDIMEFVRQIKPQTVVPIHTENPSYFLEHLRSTEIEVVIRGCGESWTF